jgi:hypothetical protein
VLQVGDSPRLRGPEHARNCPPARATSCHSLRGTAPGASGDAVFAHADQKLDKLPPTVKGTYSPSAEAAMAELHALAEASAMAACADDSGEFESAQILITAEIAQADLSDRLRLAVVAAATQTAGSMAELRIAICIFTVARRGEGSSPEAVLIALKRVINAETFEPVWLLSTWNGDQLGQKISTWCIQDYFSRTECSAVI